MKKFIPMLISLLLLFYSPGICGDPLTNGGFEILDERGFPIDWAPVGSHPISEIKVSTDAHSGKYSLSLRRIKDIPKEETGVNRVCHLLSGSQGGMLSQLKGVFSFWYKITDSTEHTKFAFYVIPMSAKPLEDTGAPRRTYLAPLASIRDKKWHRAVVTYDYTNNPEVKWVMPAVRIFGGTGEILIDDIEYFVNIGCVPAITNVYLEEKKGREGRECILKAEFQNIGDDVGDLTVTLSLPPYLYTTEPLSKEIKSLGIKEFPSEISWVIQGTRDKEDTISLSAKSQAGWEADSELKLSPSLQTEFKIRQFILSPGQKSAILLFITNKGTAFAKNISARISLANNLQLLDASEKISDPLPPQTTKILSWQIKALQESKNETIKLELSTSEGKRLFSGDVIIGASFPPSFPSLPLPNASLKDGLVILSNDNIALIFTCSSFGYGIAEIRVKQGKEWKSVGKIPYLARLIYAIGDEKIGVPIYSTAPKLSRKKSEVSLVFSHHFKDEENGDWRFQLILTLAKNSDIIKAEYSISCNRDRKVLLFEGPLLYAGEGSFGEAKQEALFPGLEWLAEGERSSSSLDIAEGHPDRIRYVPHPNKVTIPLMSVYNNGLCLALLWDPYQKWDGENDRPSAVFASPDWFEGRDAHLMGLFLPSVIHWVKENERIASMPYELAKGKTLKLKAYIYATGSAKDSLSAMDKWFALFGVPAPMPIPSGSYLKEIEFSMNAYLRSLWIPQEEQWWQIKGGGVLARKGRPPFYLYDLYQGSILSPSPDMRSRCKELMREIVDKYRTEISGEDMGFTFSNPIRNLKGEAMFVLSLINTQKADGSWRFYANQLGRDYFEGYDYRNIGPHMGVEVGTCARNAWRVLRYARMTGDEKILRYGLKALEFMKKFNLPRGAQTWEIPLHSPDVLAASDAIEAYIEGYRATGNKTYVEEAKKWARRSLPFIYMWNEKRFPFMRYATVIVYGASFHTTSWFARPVQWCGLRLAYALLQLWDYDKSFPWRIVGEGLVRSAMYQQEESGENIALWPDSIGTIEGDKADWRAYPLFSPVMILKCIYKLLDRDSQPQTIKVGEIRLNYRGYIKDVSLKAKTVSFKIKLPSGEPGRLLLAGVSKPRSIKVNARNADYEYEPNLHCLMLRFSESDNWQRVEIEDIKHIKASILPKVTGKETIDFDFLESLEGWIAIYDIAYVRLREGCIEGSTEGSDPYMMRVFIDVWGSRVSEIRINMSVSKGNYGEFYWTTEDSPLFSEDKKILFPLFPNGKFREYTIEVGRHPMWKGKRITSIRLDPTDVPSAFFRINCIKSKP